jgi:hypothetical protein
MLFMVSYSLRPDVRDITQNRFKTTGGLPGAGVKMLGRWHAVGGNRGYTLAESSDGIALGKWLQDWTDLLEFDVVPVNTDEDVMQVLGG